MACKFKFWPSLKLNTFSGEPQSITYLHRILEHGERIASIVPYGYKKSEDNPKQWVINEPAAQTVRKIFALCLAGKGPMQIARQLEEEKILSPAAYFESIGTSPRNNG